MASIGRSLLALSKNSIFFQPQRAITITSINRLKEIIEKKEGNVLTIEAKIYPDPQESKLIEPVGNGACILCSAGIELKHTDVLIISQFLRSNGTLLPRRTTGLCRIQQKRMTKMVQMALKAGLMPHLSSPMNIENPKLRFGMNKYNTYYDEETIKHKYYGISYRL